MPLTGCQRAGPQLATNQMPRERRLVMTQAVSDDLAMSAADPELVEVVRAWPYLPRTIRAAILLVACRSAPGH
jgi:hypothetical protein